MASIDEIGDCEYFHSVKDTRRPPFLQSKPDSYLYTAEETDPPSDSNPLNRFEKLYHPEFYKNTPCENNPCILHNCPYFHSIEEKEVWDQIRAQFNKTISLLVSPPKEKTEIQNVSDTQDQIRKNSVPDTPNDSKEENYASNTPNPNTS